MKFGVGQRFWPSDSDGFSVDALRREWLELFACPGVLWPEVDGRQIARFPPSLVSVRVHRGSVRIALNLVLVTVGQFVPDGLQYVQVIRVLNRGLPKILVKHDSVTG